MLHGKGSVFSVPNLLIQKQLARFSLMAMNLTFKTACHKYFNQYFIPDVHCTCVKLADLMVEYLKIDHKKCSYRNFVTEVYLGGAHIFAIGVSWLALQYTICNSSRSSNAYMYQSIRPSLFQIIACCLFGSKSLSQPMSVHILLITRKHITVVARAPYETIVFIMLFRVSKCFKSNYFGFLKNFSRWWQIIIIPQWHSRGVLFCVS